MSLSSTCITRRPDSGPATEPPKPRYHQLSIGAKVGRYTVGQEIGRGSHGVVYEAFDRMLHRRVALKSGLKTHGRKGSDEAALLSSITSPYVVTLFDVLDHREATILVLELIAGPSLDRLVRRAPLPPLVVATIGGQLAAGLEAVHRAGIVHGDIKPSNLKLSDRAVLKVLDLGIARRTMGDSRMRDSDDLVAGTVPYMPPEQFLGGVGDVRSDIWSAGAVLFELTTGRRAFDVLSPAERLRGLRDAHSPGAQWFGADAPPALVAAILDAMHPVPAKRFQSAGEFRQALAAVMPPSQVPGSGASGKAVKPKTEAISASVFAV